MDSVYSNLVERFINILIVNEDKEILHGLKEIISATGNNILLAESLETASQIISKKEIGILLLTVEDFFQFSTMLEITKDDPRLKNNYIVLISDDKTPVARLVKGIHLGAVDYINFPFNPNLVRSKIDVFKSLYYKDKRIGQLLGNIFPENILDELSHSGKFSPKRVQNGIVMFTDFVDFSQKAKRIKPLGLIKRLERYFTKFDNIIEKYNLEKIKTIGDAYMALAGVTENEPRPAIRACLAALEIRDFMITERDAALALKRDFWEIRIGLHMGPIVAGIIGSSKYSFDVWGDTVNIASRAEQVSRSGHITITSNINDGISSYFDTEPRGKIDIHKRGGSIEMFYLKQIKVRYSLQGSGRLPSGRLRRTCGLPSMDFEQLRAEILVRLRSLLPENIDYHDIAHTLNVEKAAIRYGRLEGINGEDMVLLRTAALFHDAGYIYRYDANEDFAQNMVKVMLPDFGYSPEQIEIVNNIINSTKIEVEPKTLLESIMCDADHDYLGRSDYYTISEKLRNELSSFGQEMSEGAWIDFQLDFLEKKHKFHTETAINIREIGKRTRIKELKVKKAKLSS